MRLQFLKGFLNSDSFHLYAAKTMDSNQRAVTKKHCQKIDHKNKFALTNTGDSSLVEAEQEAVFDQV